MNNCLRVLIFSFIVANFSFLFCVPVLKSRVSINAKISMTNELNVPVKYTIYLRWFLFDEHVLVKNVELTPNAKKTHDILSSYKEYNGPDRPPLALLVKYHYKDANTGKSRVCKFDDWDSDYWNEGNGRNYKTRSKKNKKQWTCW